MLGRTTFITDVKLDEWSFSKSRTKNYIKNFDFKIFTEFRISSLNQIEEFILFNSFETMISQNFTFSGQQQFFAFFWHFQSEKKLESSGSRRTRFLFCLVSTKCQKMAFETFILPNSPILSQILNLFKGFTILLNASNRCSKSRFNTYVGFSNNDEFYIFESFCILF